MNWKKCWMLNTIYRSPCKRLNGLITSVGLEQKKTYSVLRHDYITSKFRNQQILSTRKYDRNKLSSGSNDNDSFIRRPYRQYSILVGCISKRNDCATNTSFVDNRQFFQKNIGNKFSSQFNNIFTRSLFATHSSFDDYRQFYQEKIGNKFPDQFNVISKRSFFAMNTSFDDNRQFYQKNIGNKISDQFNFISKRSFFTTNSSFDDNGQKNICNKFSSQFNVISKRSFFATNTSFDDYRQFYQKNIRNKLSGPFKCISKTFSRRYSNKSLQERFTHTNTEYMEYLSSFEEEFNLLSENIGKLTKGERNRVREITPIVELVKELRDKTSEFDELHSIENQQKDEEMEKMIDEEKEECMNKIKELENKLVEEIVGREGTDNKDIILEATAGVGGQEAMLFTAEMFEMYENYVRYKGWSCVPIDYERSELGGVRRASMEVNGASVYRWLKYEGGVHRVQRIPQTEKAGRTHTSTMTVAILPLPTEIDVVIHQKDLKIETTRATGAGGQHVNTTDSAVRVIHLPTGTVAECQEERSQIKNKEKAIKILRSRIYQKELEAQISNQKATRKIQVGSSGRSEKIRTYNFNQDRITDHRIHENAFNIGHFMSGGDNLDDMIGKVSAEVKFQTLEAMLDLFVEKQNREKKKKKN